MTEAVTLIRSCLDAFNRGDIPTFLAAVADDCQWSGSAAPDLPYSGSFTGPGGAAKFLEAIGSNLDVTRFEFDRYVGDGDEVVALGRWGGTVKANGRPYDSRLALRFQVRDGKIARFVGYEDTALVASALRG